jgi:Mrp family chromosome partitioning ATPase
MTAFDRALRKAYRKPSPATESAAQVSSAAAAQDAEREFASGAWYRLEGAAPFEERPAPSLRRRVVSARRRSAAADPVAPAASDLPNSTAWRTLERRSHELQGAYDELARLERRIAERESALDVAEADLNATFARYQEREEALAQRERLLRDREGFLTAKEEELARSSHEVAERASKLERERSELQSLQTDLKRRSDSLRDAQASIESERLSLKARQDAIASQQATLESQRAELSRQKASFAEHERSMADHQRGLNDSRTQIERQRAELASQKELLDRQQAELAASVRSWEESATERKDRERQLAEKESGIKSQKDDLAAQQSRLKQREAELRLRQSALSDREAELKAQEARLRLHLESYKDHEVAFREMRQRFEEQQDQLVARTEELARRQEQLDIETATVAASTPKAAATVDPRTAPARGPVFNAGSDIVEKLRATESLRSAAAPASPAQKPANGASYRIDAPSAKTLAGPHVAATADASFGSVGGTATFDGPSTYASSRSSFEPELHESPSAAAHESQVDETLRPMWEVDEFDWPPICRALMQTEADQFAALGQAIVDCARQGKKLWGVTSLVGEAGKTTLSLCLAAWLGQQQHDVLLIDGNFTHPELAERLGISGQTCWRKTVDGTLPWGEVTVASVKDHLAVAPLALEGGGPEVTLLDPRVQQALQGIADSYDVVLIDLPTMPTQSLGHRKLPFEACLIVTQGDKTSRDALLRAADQLRKAGIDPVAVAENG